MSAVKRMRASQPDAQPSKRLKTAAHVPPKKSSLEFLTNEDARAGKKLTAKLSNGIAPSAASNVDESRATVVGKGAIDDNARHTPSNHSDLGETEHDSAESSNVSSSEESEDEEEPQPSKASGAKGVLALSNGHVSSHPADEDPAPATRSDQPAASKEVAMMDADDAGNHEQGGLEDGMEPSFGEMLQARHPDPIDVQASFTNPLNDSKAVVPSSWDHSLAAPTGLSLGTVLTQALKTNDRDLLESCLQSNDVQTIRSTIQRLPSQHITTLLQRLIERIHKRPGRTGPLMVWIQWSLVAHGGYIASQPQVMNKLRSLSQVITERASGLQTLLRLKGKLDMLSAQLDLRRSVQAASRMANAEDEDELEEGVVYVEGQNDDEWYDGGAGGQGHIGDATMAHAPSSSKKSKPQVPTPKSDESESDDFPEGVVQETADNDRSDEDEEEEDELLDVEAEEASDDEDDEEDDEEESDEEQHSSASESDDADEVSSDSESDAPIEAPNPKVLHRKR